MIDDRHRRLLTGEEGRAAARAMELLFALAKVFGARGFAPVASAHISGVSFSSLSDAGLEFLEDMVQEGAQVKVPASLNPAGMDLERWREMGVPESFALRQQRVIDSYVRMGIFPACTCTPYLVDGCGLDPRPGQILAWGESSAVTYVNSVIGARTNREGGPAALAAAIVGEIPLYGLHLDENRCPQILVKVTARLFSQADYGALGVAISRQVGGRIPLIRSSFAPSTAGLKALSAALPTFGGISIFHWSEVTPEWREWDEPRHCVTIGQREIEEAYASLRDHVLDGRPRMRFIFTGCPHLSLEEVEDVAEMLAGRRVEVPFWVCASRAVVRRAEELGLAHKIREAGALLLADTCLVVAPTPPPLSVPPGSGSEGGECTKGRGEENTDVVICTDSAKGCYYCRGIHGAHIFLESLERCVGLALGKGEMIF